MTCLEPFGVTICILVLIIVSFICAPKSGTTLSIGALPSFSPPPEKVGRSESVKVFSLDMMTILSLLFSSKFSLGN